MKNYKIKFTEKQIHKIRFAIKQEILKIDEWIKENEEYSADWLFEERKEWNDILRYLEDMPF